MPRDDAPTIAAVLPAALTNLFPDAPRRVELAAATVADAIVALDERWPGMRDRLVDSTPAIRRHINVYVDGRRAALGTKLASGAEVLIMTAISGG